MSSAPEHARRRSRARPQGRFARALHWLRWPVVVGWLAVVILIHPFAAALSGVTNDSASAYLPASAQSTRVAELQEAAQRGPGRPETDTVAVVFVRGHGLTAADRAAVASAHAAVTRLAGRVSGLQPPGAARRSADGKAAVFTAHITAPLDTLTSLDTSAVKAIRGATATAARQAGDGLQAEVTGSAAVNADSGNGTQNTLLLTAVLIVAAVFFVVYRSPLLWIFPLLGALGAIDVAQAAAHGLANAGLTVSSLSTGILIVLVFGAASDYALLLVHRYREELQHGGTAEDAMAAAMRHTLPTLLASAGTVICAMICLLAAQSASLHGSAPSAPSASSRPCWPRPRSCRRCCLCWAGPRSGRGSRVPATPGARSPGCGRPWAAAWRATRPGSRSRPFCCSAWPAPGSRPCAPTTAPWAT
jgi:RND superfamily putative drug exporter